MDLGQGKRQRLSYGPGVPAGIASGYDDDGESSDFDGWDLSDDDQSAGAADSTQGTTAISDPSPPPAVAVVAVDNDEDDTTVRTILLEGLG